MRLACLGAVTGNSSDPGPRSTVPERAPRTSAERPAVSVRYSRASAAIVKLGAGLDTGAAHAAPNLHSVHSVGPLTAAKIIGETVGVGQFHPRHAYARYDWTLNPF